jgi:hypothetical protein
LGIADWISIIKDIVTALAAATGGIIAVLGLRVWRKQLRGKTDYELARRCLRCVYRVRDSIRIIRNPVQGSDEVVQALKEIAQSSQVTRHVDETLKIQQTVYNLRWQKMNEALSDLQVELLEAEVSWGTNAVVVVEPLHKCVRKLALATSRHLRRFLPHGALTPERAEELDHVIFEDISEPEHDQFFLEVKEAVDLAEEFLQPHLKL